MFNIICIYINLYFECFYKKTIHYILYKILQFIQNAINLLNQIIIDFVIKLFTCKISN